MVLLPVVYRLSAQMCEGFEESGIACEKNSVSITASSDRVTRRINNECFSRSVPCPTFQQPLSGITVCIMLRAKDGFLG
jgi:hypothetical protein